MSQRKHLRSHRNYMGNIYSKTSDELDEYFSLGSKLQPAEIDEYVERVSLNSNDFAARLHLAGYYSTDLVKHRTSYFAQLLWFLENHPDLPYLATNPHMMLRRLPNTLFDELSAAIRKQIQSHPNKLNILINASRICIIADFKFALSCAEEAQILAPDDERVSASLRSLHHFEKAMKNTGLPGVPY